MKWKFCEDCHLNGHCQNQDMGHKCECYGKKLEDKCERLQKQLDIAVTTLKCYANPDNWDYNRFTNFFATWKLAQDNLDKIEELNK